MITSPFVGDGSLGEFSCMEELKHDRIDVWIVTRTEANAINAFKGLRRFRWRSLLVGRYPRLHSKLFTFSSRSGYAITLVGSHNLTRSGMQGNYEAGMLLLTTSGGREIENQTDCCQDLIFEMLRHGKIVFDSAKWLLLSEID
jgi:phosphatidylserine/phosphatidylglycerophosphate/cardiolipin synthase-like enzyme